MSVAIVPEAFSTLEQARAHLNLREDDTDNDDLVRELINRTARMIQDYVGRTLKKTTYVNAIFEGTGEATLYVPEFPVLSVTSLKMSATRDFASAPSLTIFDGTGAQAGSSLDVVGDPETGELTLVNGTVWPKGPGTVQMTYSAGYNAVSNLGQQFVQAELLNIADWWFAIGKDQNLQSAAMGGEAETYVNAGLCEKVKALLVPHRRPACVA